MRGCLVAARGPFGACTDRLVSMLVVILSGNSKSALKCNDVKSGASTHRCLVLGNNLVEQTWCAAHFRQRLPRVLAQLEKVGCLKPARDGQHDTRHA